MGKLAESQGKSVKFFKNVRAEMKKVVWPSKSELVSYTGVVLFTCLIFGLGIWLLDSIFTGALKAILNINL